MRSLLLFTLLFSTSIAAQTQGPFEQILVPFDTSTIAAGGAMWHTELWVRNTGSRPVNVWAQECFQFGLPAVCSRKVEIPAGRTILVDGFEPDGEMPGVLLYVQRDRSSDVTFNLRVRDASRGADDIGTELPVVREAGLKSGTVTLINVPLQPNGRVHLRLYTPHPLAAFTVRVHAEPQGQVLAEGVYAAGIPADGKEPPELPMMIDASPIFGSWIIDRVRVTIEMTGPPGGRFWPLLTITNRRNNRITTVTPQ